MSEANFRLAGAEIDWPIGSAPGLTNHPDIEVVANRFDNLAAAGLSFVPLGSWTLGAIRAGNAFVRNESDTGWDYLEGDEYVDLEAKAGYNAKGLPNPGTDNGMPRLHDFIDLGRSRGVEVGLSLSPHSGSPLEELPEILAHAETALKQGVLYVEVNLSCPNVPGRPAFYLDTEGVAQFYEMLHNRAALLNRHGHPGVYPKFGPFDQGVSYWEEGNRIHSNTLGNQEPKLPNGEPAIRVNNGKAGMSGPALKELGRQQLQLTQANASDKQGDVISVLGIDSGREVKVRLDMGAAAVQMASILYWPQLVGCETPEEVVEQIKQEFIEAAA